MRTRVRIAFSLFIIRAKLESQKGDFLDAQMPTVASYRFRAIKSKFWKKQLNET